jgi:Raf kinase inhibitor-like YbhB/YbcL family protein
MIRTTFFTLLILPLIMHAQDQSVGPGSTFTLRSTDLGGQATHKQIFGGFGCTGENISPQLEWSNAPEGTRSFAITMYDPDAPTGSGWWHWVVYDIPASTNNIPSGAGTKGGTGMPRGAKQARTDFGEAGYGGPCPPEGDGPHRYIITIHALGTERLDVPDDASPALIGFNLTGNSLARASIIFYHER